MPATIASKIFASSSQRDLISFYLTTQGGLRVSFRPCDTEQSPSLLRYSVVPFISMEFIMDREHIKGVADYAKGAIKETIGKITGDKQMQAEGKLDKVKGAVHNAVGDTKDALRDASKDE
jgi:uncharacterized protein YjbJ (UPF0337 family)